MCSIINAMYAFDALEITRKMYQLVQSTRSSFIVERATQRTHKKRYRDPMINH